MSSRHAITPRGLDATRSPLFQGRFGRMFRNLAPAQFGPTEADNIANLAALGDAMTADFDPPNDGPMPRRAASPRSTPTSVSSSTTTSPSIRSAADQGAGPRRPRRLPHARAWTWTTSTAAARAISPTCTTALKFLLGDDADRRRACPTPTTCRASPAAP